MSKRKSDRTFFQKKSKQGSHDDPSQGVSSEITVDVESESDANIAENEGVLVETVPVSSGFSCSSTSSIARGSIPIECDIGKLKDSGVDIKGLSRDSKYRLLTTEPNPDPLSYPCTRPCPSSSFRQFKPDWLKYYPWMHYSIFSDGVYCRACVVFAQYQVGGHDLGQFVLGPFRYWTKTTERATEHAKNGYHRKAMAMMGEFLVRYESPSHAVDVVLNRQVRQTMETNQKVVESLLRIVILCGKQGLALRGHRDDRIDWQSVERSNEGNFVQLVRFRAETDTILSAYLSKAPKNACYTSKTIQNELLSVVADSIHNSIISEVKSAKYYSIIADELTDAANHEELSLVFRYVHNEEIREVFVDFLEVERITGRVLGEAIISWLKAHDISPADMRGQCYDGASNMSGARSGVKAVVQEVAPKAMYYHCAAHHLNLSVVSACSIQAFKNAESYIGEIARFFNYSAKRQRLLDTSIEVCDSTPNAKKLKDACRTRWVERIDSYAVFLELVPSLYLCLEAMVHPQSHQELGTDWSWDGETITKANGFLFQLQSSLFLVSFQILVQVLQILRELTIKLQMKAMDVVYAYKLVNKVVSNLKSMRTNSASEFRKQFAEAARLAKKLHGDDFELTMPRLSGRQRHRSNPPSSTPEEYYRITLYDEFLSHVVSELEERFVNNPSHTITIGLLYLLPSECIKLGNDVMVPEDLAKAVQLFKDDLPHAVMFNTEYDSWVRQWKENSSAAIPDTLIGALKECSVLAYPNLNILLILALTLPITSCESERSFSQLKLIKTGRHATMSESRLSSLSLMKINRERCNDLLSEQNMKKLVQSFSLLHPRRMKLPYMLRDEIPHN